MITHAESHHGQRLLTKKEVARHLGVSIRTVNNLVDRGQLPKPIVYSRQTIRWRPEDLHAYAGSTSTKIALAGEFA